MILFPPAKINLGLNVLRKRQDGFHDIETCMTEVPLTDVLEILRADQFSFLTTGLPVDGGQENNLCVKAYRLLESKYDLSPVYIHLHKNIPMGAGLGGGSADATYVLLGLNAVFNLELSKQELKEYASLLGSDCAFFVEGGVQMASGRGEVLSSSQISLKGKYIKLINPGIHIGTQEAYSSIIPDENYSVTAVLKSPITEWKENLHNSFEEYAFQKHPVIEQLKSTMYSEGAIYASMSGSGASVFGIFEQHPVASNGAYFERVYKL